MKISANELMGSEAGLLVGPTKEALSVYQELLCDWPPISVSEARALSDVLASEKVNLLKIE
jgi:hypothetical protein